MSRRKPWLVIFVGCYFGFLATIIFFASVNTALLFISPVDFDRSFVLSWLMVNGFSFLLLVSTGFGVVEGQKWARISAIVIFTLTLMSSFTPKNESIQQFSSLPRGSDFGPGLSIGLSLLGLYAMVIDQSTKNYFDLTSRPPNSNP
jgi:hypothetical protein